MNVNPLALILILAVRLYRLMISPAQIFLFGAGGGCRFSPGCSQFALDALREHPLPGATILVAKRICRCHPWGGGGPDPVPPFRRPLKKQFHG